MPEERRNIVETLRQADAELQEERMSAEAEGRLAQLVQTGVQRPSPWRLLWLPAAAALAAALLVWLLLPTKQAPPITPARPAVRLAGFTVVRGEARSRGARQVECVGPGCTLEVPLLQVRLELQRGATVVRREDRLALLAGRATCHVARRRGGDPPLVVQVSHGRIEVIGTVFSLRQERGGGGEVRLRRGAIQFVSDDGVTIRLSPGERLSWPLPPREDAGPASPRPRPGDAPRQLTPRETETLRHLVARLRNQGRYREAVRALRRALPRVADPVARESFSYELGVILTDHLGGEQACRHWRGHLRTYGARRYGQEIEQARSRLGCL